MEIENIASILILYVHAPLGGLALLAGAIALTVKKGGKIHRNAGKLFFYSMLISAITSLFIAVLPNHESPFLFAIGLFSVYLLISGIRSLKFKGKTIHLKIDKTIAFSIIFLGLAMIAFPIVFYKQINLILTVFGMASIFFGWRDLQLFKNPKQLKTNYLKQHIARMTGGYIAAVSAFFVVNQILPGIWNWFAPSIIGTTFIIYSIRKVSR